MKCSAKPWALTRSLYVRCWQEYDLSLERATQFSIGGQLRKAKAYSSKYSLAKFKSNYPLCVQCACVKIQIRVLRVLYCASAHNLGGSNVTCPSRRGFCTNIHVWPQPTFDLGTCTGPSAGNCKRRKRKSGNRKRSSNVLACIDQLLQAMRGWVRGYAIFKLLYSFDDGCPTLESCFSGIKVHRHTVLGSCHPVSCVSSQTRRY